MPAAVYEVGPGKPLTSIGQAPWATLGPGDEVRIHWRSAPYQEKWVLTAQGSPFAPIVVRGIPGPNGERPVIEGSGAVTAPGLNYWSEDRGILKIGGSNTPADIMPRHLVIEGLAFHGANESNTFTDDNGATQSYRRNASGIFLEKGEHITIRNCEFSGNGNGLFVASSDAEPTRDLLIQSNYLHDNGNVSSAFEHNSYIAAIDVTYEYNRYGPPLAGSIGAGLKDRSAGTVVRYNWIEGGNRQLDLVEGEDSSQIRNHPDYDETFVYGNILIEPAGAGNRQIIHYGGDGGNPSSYRKGLLHFYNNTVVSTRTDRNTIFRLSTNDERCDARNNIFYTTLPGSDLSLLDSAGTLDLTNNWIKPGWRNSFDGGFAGSVSGASTMIEGVAPGFMDEAGQDFRLAPGGQALDAGVPLHADTFPENVLTRRYVRHRGAANRMETGPIDLGAMPRRLSRIEAPALTGVRDGSRMLLSWSHPGPATGYIIGALIRLPTTVIWRGIALADGLSHVATPTDRILGYFVMAYDDSGGDAIGLSWPSNGVPVD